MSYVVLYNGVAYGPFETFDKAEKYCDDKAWKGAYVIRLVKP